MNDAEAIGKVWHYAVNSEATGPVSVETLAELIQGRQLGPAAPVWRDGMSEWAPLVQIPELSRYLLEPPTSPTGPIPWSGMEPLDENAGMRMLLPVGRSGWAIAAGYLGLFSALMVPAPLALITGIVAIWHIRSSEHLHGMGRAIFGIIAGAAGSLALIWMLFMAAIA